MLCYDNSVYEKSPDLMKYFTSGIWDENKNISHCLLFWGADIDIQYQIALEIARLLNCNNSGEKDCDCLNCRWIREQTHPAVRVITRLDGETSLASEDEDDSTSGKKNISIAQARAITAELAISSDYHRVFIFCDRDEDGNLLPLNQLNFPEVTSNALLKTFEEPPSNTTFIFLTKDKTDVISTVVSRAQSFFVPADNVSNFSYDTVKDFISEYWTMERNQVLEFADNLLDLTSNNDPKQIFCEIQNYIFDIMKSNNDNKALYYRLMQDIKYVEDAKRQVSLTPSMQLNTVCENLSYKLLLH